jgi:hypothetical protein
MSYSFEGCGKPGSCAVRYDWRDQLKYIAGNELHFRRKRNDGSCHRNSKREIANIDAIFFEIENLCSVGGRTN